MKVGKGYFHGRALKKSAYTTREPLDLLKDQLPSGSVHQQGQCYWKIQAKEVGVGRGDEKHTG